MIQFLKILVHCVGIHDWTMWATVSTGRDKQFMYLVYEQERHCKICGKVQLRSASAM